MPRRIVSRMTTRARLGPLRRLRVGASSHARYLYAGLRFQAWLDAFHYPAATDKHTMDRPLCAEIEDLWLSGEEKSLVGDTIPAVQFFIMRRRILSGASAKDDPQRQVERFPLCPQCTSWILCTPGYSNSDTFFEDCLAHFVALSTQRRYHQAGERGKTHVFDVLAVSFVCGSARPWPRGCSVIHSMPGCGFVMAVVCAKFDRIVHVLSRLF